MKGRGNGMTLERATELIKAEVDKIGLRPTARGLGISPAMVHRYYNGKSQATTETLQKLANYFNETFIIEIKPEKASR